MAATSLIVKDQFSTLFPFYTLDVLPLWKINFYITAFDGVRINNKFGFQLAKRFAQREFFKFFITKDN